jgi:CheY-like chemotaxis protein
MELIEEMLADVGCESVTTAATVDQAVALVDGRVFDVAMLDVNQNRKQSRVRADVRGITVKALHNGG